MEKLLGLLDPLQGILGAKIILKNIVSPQRNGLGCCYCTFVTKKWPRLERINHFQYIESTYVGNFALILGSLTIAPFQEIFWSKIMLTNAVRPKLHNQGKLSFNELLRNDQDMN